MTIPPIVIFLLFASLAIILWQTLYIPYEKRAEERRLRELFKCYCPMELMNALWRYAGTDLSFTKLTPEVKRAFEDIFSDKGVRAGIELIRTGQTRIPLHVENSSAFRDLCVTYRHGQLATIELSPPYRAPTMLPDW
jgi:hypothetical protein